MRIRKYLITGNPGHDIGHCKCSILQAKLKPRKLQKCKSSTLGESINYTSISFAHFIIDQYPLSGIGSSMDLFIFLGSLIENEKERKKERIWRKLVSENTVGGEVDDTTPV